MLELSTLYLLQVQGLDLAQCQIRVRDLYKTGVNFINFFRASFLYKSYILAAFSSYILAKNHFRTKKRAKNVDEIDTRLNLTQN